MIYIRQAQFEDLPDILGIINDAICNTTALYEYEPRTLTAQREWFETKQVSNLPVLVAATNNRTLGFASYGPFRPWPAYLHTVENSIYIASDQRGKGIGTLLLADLIKHAQIKSYHAIVAGIDAENTASINLHKKFGFTQVAHFHQVGWKFERWLDLIFLERLLKST